MILNKYPLPSRGILSKLPKLRTSLMTVCVATLCDNREAIILVADKMVSVDVIATDMDIRKIREVHQDWWVMLAGNTAPNFDIIDATGKELEGYKTLTVDIVMNIIAQSYHTKRSRDAEATYLTKRGFNIERFITEGSKLLPKSLFTVIDSHLQSYRLGIELLVAGFDSQQQGHIFSIDDDGIPFRHDIPGFYAIGSGSVGARYMMYYRSLSYKTFLREALYYAVEGKYFGELAPGVGIGTDIYILRPNKEPIIIEQDTIDDILIHLCEILEPRELKKKQLHILNELKELKELPFIDEDRDKKRKQ